MLRYVTSVTFLFVYFRIWNRQTLTTESREAPSSAR